MSYTTQPGTLQHRVVEHLRSLPPGAKVSTPDLVVLLDADPSCLAASLASPRKHGLLVAEQAKTMGRPMLWSLGTGAPQPAAADADPPVRSVTRAEVAEVPRVPLFPAGAAAPAPAPKPRPLDITPAAIREVPPEPAKKAVRAAVWSSGELAIETADETFVFDKDIAREVIAFLKRVEVPA
jgi:hypothetical protein